MANLKQCDRCKFTGSPIHLNNVATLNQDRSFDLCDNCFRLVEQILCDGGAQWIMQTRTAVEVLTKNKAR